MNSPSVEITPGYPFTEPLHLERPAKPSAVPVRLVPAHPIVYLVVPNGCRGSTLEPGCYELLTILTVGDRVAADVRGALK